jgi:hypothetical protein
MVLKLQGGVSIPAIELGINFADVSSPAGTSRVKISSKSKAAPGRIIDKGINVELKCSCTPSYSVIQPIGFRLFDLVYDGASIKCPNCRTAGGKLETVGFYNCEYKTYGTKMGSGGPENHESNWKAVPLEDEYQHFDTNKDVGKVNWIRLMIEARPIGAADDCPICLVNLASGNVSVTPGCRHMFHTECINDWRRLRRNCPCCRQAV